MTKETKEEIKEKEKLGRQSEREGNAYKRRRKEASRT